MNGTGFDVVIENIGGGAYWAGRAVAPPQGQALLFALPLLCLHIDFLSFHVEQL